MIDNALFALGGFLVGYSIQTFRLVRVLKQNMEDLQGWSKSLDDIGDNCRRLQIMALAHRCQDGMNHDPGLDKSQR